MISKWVSGDRTEFDIVDADANADADADTDVYVDADDGIILDEIKILPKLRSRQSHFVGMTAISHFVQHIKSV